MAINWHAIHVLVLFGLSYIEVKVNAQCTTIATCYFCTTPNADDTKTVANPGDCQAELISSSYRTATYEKATGNCFLASSDVEVDQTTTEHVTYIKKCNTDCTVFALSKTSYREIDNSADYSYTLDRYRCFKECMDTAGCSMLHYRDSSDACDLFTSCGTSCSTSWGWYEVYTRWCYSGADCGFAPDVANGRITYDDETTQQGARVSFSCDTGSDPANSNVRTCQSDTNWSTEDFTCNPADCGAPPTITNAVSSYNSTVYGSFANYTCITGYSLYRWSTPDSDNLLTVECKVSFFGSSTYWSPTVSYYTCDPTNCWSPGYPANGQVIAPVTTYGAIATFQCNPGYDLNSIETLTCNADGQWDGTYPTCVIKNCGPLVDPGNGSVSAPTQTYLSTATYSCEDGYNPVGTTVRTCNSSGLWSDSEPSCELIDCGSLAGIPNGYVNVSETTFNNTANYSCLVGYKLDGDETRTCEDSGSWSNSPPSCESIDCGPLVSPANGDVFAPDTTYNQQANYSCDNGYDLVGVFVRTCYLSELWSDTEPMCIIKNCGPLVDPGNGSVSAPTQTYLGTATYSCEDGYSLVGATERTCNSSGLWSDSEPSCQLIDCGNLAGIPNGYVNVSETTFNNMANYFCLVGYKLDGVETRTCENSGSWSNSTPSCESVDCVPLQSPANGSVSAPVTTYNQQATYSCDAGYYIVGVSLRTCNSSGLWSDSKPSCELIDCGSLAGIPNGFVNVSDTTYSNTANYSCLVGYKLDGVETRTCEDSGSWSNSTPSCESVECGPLQSPANGSVSAPVSTYNQQATYSCDAGYYVEGVSVRTCNSSELWSDTAPTCEIVDCGNLIDVADGTVSMIGTTENSQATYTCNAGYDLSGDATRTCESSKMWTGSEPSCNPKDCGHPVAPGNGSVNAPLTTYTREATFSCDAGFELNGRSVHVCTSSGVWNDTAPTCEPMDCGGLPVIPKGTVIFSLTTFGSQAVYSCNTGFELVGDSVRTCNESALWNSTAPTCSLVDCDALTDPINGSVNHGATTYNAVAIYMCSTGYSLNGTTSRKCEAGGLWSDTEPICDVIDCGPLPDPANGTVNISSTLYMYSGQAVFTCNQGYTRSGPVSRSCTVSGDWSAGDPTCVFVDCGSLTAPSNGTVNFTDTFFEATAIYSCDVGFELSGTDSRRCTDTGVWDPSEPVCNELDCGPLANQTFGNVSTDNGTTVGEIATYNCFPGYNMLGIDSRVCMVNRTWSGSEPVCDPKNCGSLAAPGNGSVSTPGGTVFPENAFYSCDTGYILNGPSVRGCQDDGTWNASAPSCTLADCGGLPSPTNGLVSTGGGTTYNKVAIYTCNAGHTVLGSFARTCQSNGVWSGAAPSCVVAGSVPGVERIFIAPCLCVQNKTFTNLTEEEIIAKLIAETSIDLKNTSMARSKLECRGDPRTSSAAIGMLGVGLLALVGGLVLTIDSIRVCKHFSNRRDRYRT